jgi:hypothetical protein
MVRFGRVSNTFFLGLWALASSFLQPSLALSAAAYGSGNNACADWTQINASGDDRGIEEEWLLGYLSGISSNSNIGEADPDALLAGIDSYCAANPRHTIAQAARGLVLPPGIAVAGLGSSESELANQAAMNEICRNSYGNRAFGSYPVRWATTTDFKEYSTTQGWNQGMIKIDEDFALRADNTLVTSDGIAYDQATGARGRQGFPGAVIYNSSGAFFRGKKFRARPLCVWGRPNSDLR